MEQKSTYHCLDGRTYQVTMTWNENFKDAEKVFRIGFKAIETNTNRELALPREIGTFSIADVQETLGERVKYYFRGDREEFMSDNLTTAYRRVCDWIERGK